MDDDRAVFPRGRADLVFRQLDEEWVIYDPAADMVHVLNLPAALVWAHCDGEFSEAEISDAVAESFGEKVERSVVENDVREVLDRFDAAGLLV